MDLLAQLRRIGVDEVSDRTGHRYATVVVDPDTSRLVWMAPGRDAATVRRFFDETGLARTKAVTPVSAGGAAWITSAGRTRRAR